MFLFFLLPTEPFRYFFLIALHCEILITQIYCVCIYVLYEYLFSVHKKRGVNLTLCIQCSLELHKNLSYNLNLKATEFFFLYKLSFQSDF